MTAFIIVQLQDRNTGEERDLIVRGGGAALARPRVSSLFRRFQINGLVEYPDRHTFDELYGFDHRRPDFSYISSDIEYDDDDDTSGTLHFFYSVAGGRLPTDAEITSFVRYTHPETYCRHSYDCCGQWYNRSADWMWVSPNVNSCIIMVTQRTALNI